MKIKYVVMLICLFLTAGGVSVLAADGSGLSVGVMAPEIKAINSEGEPFVLSDAVAQNPIVLIFYRGGWCPYCNVQLQMFEKQIDAFEQRGVEVVAVSVDNLAEVQKMVEGNSYGVELAQKNPGKYDIEKMGYTFDIVGGMSIETLKEYNALHQVDDETNKKYLEWGIDLEASSGEDHHIIAIPATYVIDTDGKIIFAQSNKDYTVRTMPKEVLMFLDQLEQGDK